MSKRASAPGLLFLKKGVGTNAFGQVLDTTQESEVPAMGGEIVTCPDKLRGRCWFFSKMLVEANLVAQTLDTRRASEVLTMIREILNVQTNFGAGALLFENGCGDKCFRPSLGHKTGK